MGSGQLRQQRFGRRLRRRRILSRDQVAGRHRVRLPVRGFGVVTAILLQHVLHQEGHHVGQPGRRLLAIAETGDGLVPDDGRAVRSPGRAERRRSMADGSHRFAGRIQRLDQIGGMAILGEIPQRPMATTASSVGVLDIPSGLPVGIPAG